MSSAELIYDAIQGMTGSLDTPTVYMSPEEYQRFRDDTIGRYYGVGILTVLGDASITIEKVFDDSPARRAGLLAGDRIVAIDEEWVTSENVGEIVNAIKGPRGSMVALRVQRDDSEEYLDFQVARDRIRTPSVETERLGDGIAWVRILQFQENTGRELRRALAGLDRRNEPLLGLVLDLRNNPGGFLDEAVEVADVFLGGGTILTTRGRRVEERTHVARAPGTRADLPLVVLQNKGSASAAEIVSGALQDHERAEILGTTSYGKGSVQTTYEFADGSALKLTIARLYTPDDRTIQGTGVEPDVAVEEDEAPWVDEQGQSVYVQDLDLSPFADWVLEDPQMCAAVTTLMQVMDE